jgi:fibronectin-binding autotransporter adhesin
MNISWNLSRPLGYFLAASFAMLLVLLFNGSAYAATRTWDGDTDMDWATAANWDSDTLPVAGDDLVFDTDAVSFSFGDVVNNNFTAGTSFNSISVTGSGNVPEIDGNDFELVAGITSSQGLTINQDVTFNGTQTLSSLFSTRFEGAVNIGTSDITLDDGSFLFNGVLSGSGNIDTTNGAYISLAESNTWTGNLTAASGDNVLVCNVDGLGVGGNHSFADGARVQLLLPANGSTNTYDDNISIGGNSSATYDFESAITFTGGCSGGSGGSDPDAPFNPSEPTKYGDLDFTGTLTLTADTNIFVSASHGFDSVIDFSDVVLGGFSLDRVATFGAQELIVNSTSQPALPDVETTYDDDQDTLQVFVYAGNVAVVDGVRNDVAVFSGATLMGTGTVDEVVVFSGGVLAPGNSPGCLASGNLTLSGTFEVEIAGTTVCTEYDQQQVTGTVDVSGATLDVSFLSGFTPADGDEFVIIENDGTDSVTGTFAGLAEGDTLTVGSTEFTVSYVGGTGNDVVLSVGDAVGAPDTGFGLFSTAQPVAFVAIGLATTVVLVINLRGVTYSASRR